MTSRAFGRLSTAVVAGLVLAATLSGTSGGRGSEAVGSEAVGSEPFTGLFPHPEPPATVPPDPPAVARQPIDGKTLVDALAGSGLTLGPGTSVYAARVVPNGGSLGYREFEAGAGARWTGFWPASSIKLVVAVGALRYLDRLGFTGAATVRFADGFEDQVRHVYDLAIRQSDNQAYDRLLQIAGIDWLNDEFLTPANGFPDTVVQRPYSGIDVRSSPAMTVTEGSSSTRVSARRTTRTLTCRDGSTGNCSTPFELSEAMRRVVLDVELPRDERIDIDPTDRAALTSAMLRGRGFLEPGVTRALGPAAQVFSKFGWVPGHSCVDVGLVEDAVEGQRYFVAIVAPDDGGRCTSLEVLAEKVTTFLRALQPAT